MDFLVVYDRWCEGRVRALLLFLEEWFSIGQKYAERGMIALYMVLISSPPHHTKIDIAVGIWVAISTGFMMWMLHRRPEATRERPRHFPRFHAGIRVSVQVFLVYVAALCFRSSSHSKTITAAQIVYIIFYYMIDITSNSERGRRRKLAWAKIKELFGTDWIPKPVAVPH